MNAGLKLLLFSVLLLCFVFSDALSGSILPSGLAVFLLAVAYCGLLLTWLISAYGLASLLFKKLD